MNPTHTSDADALHSITWALQSFTVNHTYKSTGPSRLYLDRADGAFGIVSPSSSSITTLAQYPDDEPICFEGKIARAASWRGKCKKIPLLFHHLQLDLEFASVDEAHAFLRVVEDIAMSAGNHFFYSYEVHANIPFVRADFDMVNQGYTDRTPQSWLPAPTEHSEWAQLRQTGEWSDFTVVAEGKRFPVHRVRLCKESLYFKAVCSGGFAESAKQSIELPESAQIIGALLDEIYDTSSSTTGCLFTNFALRSEMEKEQAMAQLLALFIASDKYNLEKVKQKVSEAIVDRLPFVKDPLTVIDIASNVYHDEFPDTSGGLRRALVIQIDNRLPAIVEDEGAWEEYSKNKTVMKALHIYQCNMRDDVSSCSTLSTPVTPVKINKKGRAQDRGNGD